MSENKTVEGVWVYELLGIMQQYGSARGDASARIYYDQAAVVIRAILRQGFRLGREAQQLADKVANVEHFGGHCVAKLVEFPKEMREEKKE